jgi:hypothetical protein
MKKFFVCFSLAVILVVGLYGMFDASRLPRTYDGSKTDIKGLSQNWDKYDTKDADGITNIIVKENLEKTHALNTVSSVTFDFRGYDTLGESFILLTAISGSMAILRKGFNGRRGKDEEKHQG